MNRRIFAATAFVASVGALGARRTGVRADQVEPPHRVPARQPHTENILQFVKDVEAGSGGKLLITVHANASLFKAPEIKRAVADRPGADRRSADVAARE